MIDSSGHFQNRPRTAHEVKRLVQRRPGSSLGFSLLEALVAMAIAAISLGTLYRAVGQSAKVAADVEWRSEAALAAAAVLSSATFADDLIKSSSGQMGRWFWRTQVIQESLLLRDQNGRSIGEPLLGGRVMVNISSVQGGETVFTTVSWKPFRAVP